MMTTQLPVRADALSRTTRVHDAVRADILAGRLVPGSRLGFASLVNTYDCSIGVVREALQRLLEQGLVTSVPKLGFRVVEVSEEDLLDLTVARCEIEVLALRYAIAGGDLDWEGRVVAAHHRLDRTPMYDAEDPARFSEDWVLAHSEYHQALLDGCRNTRILASATMLRDSAELYRRWSAPLHDRGRDIVGEHRAILDATVGRDSERACELLGSHIRRTTDALITSRAT